MLGKIDFAEKGVQDRRSQRRRYLVGILPAGARFHLGTVALYGIRLLPPAAEFHLSTCHCHCHNSSSGIPVLSENGRHANG